jgi:PDGLE domain
MTRSASFRLVLGLGLALAVGLAFFASPYASSAPDGLTRVAADKGFDGAAETRSSQQRSPIPGYEFPGVADVRLAKGFAGFVGTLGVFAFGYGTAYVLRRRRPNGAAESITATT